LETETAPLPKNLVMLAPGFSFSLGWDLGLAADLADLPFLASLLSLPAFFTDGFFLEAAGLFAAEGDLLELEEADFAGPAADADAEAAAFAGPIAFFTAGDAADALLADAEAADAVSSEEADTAFGFIMRVACCIVDLPPRAATLTTLCVLA
jgi:hypothetical protein